MTGTEADLIARALAGRDPEAFGTLVALHQSAVRRFLRSQCRDAAWADDLAQETFVLAYRRLAGFRGDASFLSWLLGIAHNLYRNARRGRREPPAEEGDAVPATDPAGLSDLRQDLDAAVAQLAEEERTVIHLAYGQGLSHREIAAATGMPMGTVKTHLARGKDRLRGLLAAWNPR